MPEKRELKDDDLITVCAECFQASCWHGDFMCEKAYDADIVEKTVKELRELKAKSNEWENEEHWIRQKYGDILGKNE